MNEDYLFSLKFVLIDVKVFLLLILCWIIRNDVLYYKYMYININVNFLFCVEEFLRYYSIVMEFYLVLVFCCLYV